MKMDTMRSKSLRAGWRRFLLSRGCAALGLATFVLVLAWAYGWAVSTENRAGPFQEGPRAAPSDREEQTAKLGLAGRDVPEVEPVLAQTEPRSSVGYVAYEQDLVKPIVTQA